MTPDKVICDRCGKTETAPELHVLPDGWERHVGDDYCNECMSVINLLLAAALKGRQS